MQLTYPETTTYQPLPGTRCCNNCEPRLFEVERITLDKVPALKRGKKRKLPSVLEDAVRNNLSQWRDNELLDHFYGGTSIIAGSALLDDGVIEKLAVCGERVETMEEFTRHARWLISFNTGTGEVTEYGRMLLEKFQTIYSAFDIDMAAKEAELEDMQSLPPEVSVESFYGGTSQQPRWVETLTPTTYLQNNSNAETGANQTRGTGRATRRRGARGGRSAAGAERGRGIRRGRGT